MLYLTYVIEEKHMKSKSITSLKSWEEIKAEWQDDPQYMQEWEKRKPEYELARQIIKARLTMNISQAELAKKAGTDQAVISRMENMNAHPSIDLIQRIARALGTSIHLTIR
jgi:ribosome-binding protein aMBF1 (putative translation factor)